MKVMASNVAVIILVGTAMFITNPTKDNFENFLEKKAARNIEKYVGGSKSVLDEMVNTPDPVTSIYSASQFTRKNYYVVSIYESDSSESTVATKYLGVFKIFILLE